jgi:hypothetical protein
MPELAPVMMAILLSRRVTGFSLAGFLRARMSQKGAAGTTRFPRTKKARIAPGLSDFDAGGA